MRRLALALCLTLLVAPSLARAEDETTPEQAFAAAVKAWPAPSAESAFRFEGVAFLGKARLGTFLVEAQPALDEAQKVIGWQVHERLELTFGEKSMHGDAVSVMSADLRPVSGHSVSTFDEGEKHTWATKDGRVRVERAKGEGEPEVEDAAVEGPLLPCNAGALFLARFAPATKAAYRGTSFEGQDGDGAVAPFTAAVDPDARLDGRPVLLVRVTRTDTILEVVAELKTREIRRVTLSKPDDSMRLLVLPPDLAKEVKVDDVFAREPRNAKEIAVQTLYALTVKDRAGIEKAFRWETMYAAVRKQLEAAGVEPIPELADWRADTIEGMLKAPSGDQELPPPEQIRVGLLATMESLRLVAAGEGLTAVMFPKSFGSLLVVAEEKDGVWKAVGVRKM